MKNQYVQPPEATKGEKQFVAGEGIFFLITIVVCLVGIANTASW